MLLSVRLILKPRLSVGVIIVNGGDSSTSQDGQCSLSAPRIEHLLISAILGYDLKMQINLCFHYALLPGLFYLCNYAHHHILKTVREQDVGSRER